MLKNIFSISLIINSISAAFILYATLPKWEGKWDQLSFVIPGMWATGFILLTFIFWLIYLYVTKSWSTHMWLLALFMADIIIIARIWR
jgi:hypothetical protein